MSPLDARLLNLVLGTGFATAAAAGAGAGVADGSVTVAAAAAGAAAAGVAAGAAAASAAAAASEATLGVARGAAVSEATLGVAVVPLPPASCCWDPGLEDDVAVCEAPCLFLVGLRNGGTADEKLIEGESCFRVLC